MAIKRPEVRNFIAVFLLLLCLFYLVAMKNNRKFNDINLTT